MIRVGIGGWVFEPWRGVFYPKGLPQARELAHASRQLASIEINGTFYATQKPDSFLRWADETPDDVVISLQGPRYSTPRRVSAEARPQRTSEAAPTGYTPAALRTWADRARTWAEGRTADDLATIAGPAPEANARDVFIYMIAGAKVRAPAAAMALIERLK